jgi:hypothetical protein
MGGTAARRQVVARAGGLKWRLAHPLRGACVGAKAQRGDHATRREQWQQTGFPSPRQAGKRAEVPVSSRPALAASWLCSAWR